MTQTPLTKQAKSLRRSVVFGAVLGVVTGVLGLLLRLQAAGVPVDPSELGAQGVAGAIAGMVITAILGVTREFRQRGRVQHYSSWMIASVLGVLVLVLPHVPSDGWKPILFALWLGGSAGLALGVIARQLDGSRW